MLLNPSIFETPDALYDAAAEAVRAALTDAQTARGQSTLMLSGGNTPAPLYTRLGDHPGRVDPGRVHFYWSDERWVPPDHPDRNEALARRLWLGPWRVPESHIHPLVDRLDDPRAAARRAHDRLSGVSAFDLALLGLGDDGHTASLFPGRSVEEEAFVAPVFNTPKPPPTRLTVTPAALSRARAILVLAVGREKADVLKAIRHGGAADFPITPWLRRPGARLLADRAAWGPDDLPAAVNKF